MHMPVFLDLIGRLLPCLPILTQVCTVSLIYNPVLEAKEQRYTIHSDMFNSMVGLWSAKPGSLNFI